MFFIVVLPSGSFVILKWVSEPIWGSRPRGGSDTRDGAAK